MARQGLVGRPTKRRFRSLTRPDKAAEPTPDLVGRDFTASAIDLKWCGDLTEIPTDEGKLYLAHVEDLASRRLPGFAMSEHHDAPLAVAALRWPPPCEAATSPGSIFHSDQGSEYTAELFETACRRLGVSQSMGRVGSCFDNAASESFHSTLEFELLRKRRFATKAEARAAVAGYIDRYNRTRRHSSCEMKSPIEFEAILAARAAEAVTEEKVAENRPPRSPQSHETRSSGTRHRADDRLDQQSAPLHGWGEAQVLRIVGPNCLGVVSTRCGLNATFTAQRFLPGGIAVAAQSGGVGIAIAAEAEQRNAGISAFVSMGNKVDVSSNDLLRLWADDDDTNVALIYLESFGDPIRFARVARAVSRRMPIVALKAGRTEPGRRGARSHTAALATDDVVVDALFAHTGVIRARTLEELIDVGLLLDRQPSTGRLAGCAHRQCRRAVDPRRRRRRRPGPRRARAVGRAARHHHRARPGGRVDGQPGRPDLGDER